MKIQIKNRWTGIVVFEADAETVGGAVVAAVASKANLSKANLYGVDLTLANLYGANFSEADFSKANLTGANLYGANLTGANLYGANLTGANLTGANLTGANLYWAKNWEHILPTRNICASGDLIVWKKLAGGTICKLRIPENAKRVGGLVGRKCRAEFAVVLEGEGSSIIDYKFTYRIGNTVAPKEPFNDDPRVECASGIHFFITREEAKAYKP